MNLWPRALNVRWVYPLMQREMFEEVDYFEVVFLLKKRRKHAIPFVQVFQPSLGETTYFIQEPESNSLVDSVTPFRSMFLLCQRSPPIINI